jgi:hypothetical protein
MRIGEINKNLVPVSYKKLKDIIYIANANGGKIPSEISATYVKWVQGFTKKGK